MGKRDKIKGSEGMITTDLKGIFEEWEFKYHVLHEVLFEFDSVLDRQNSRIKHYIRRNKLGMLLEDSFY